jgi:hypothetical protein
MPKQYRSPWAFSTRSFACAVNSTLVNSSNDMQPLSPSFLLPPLVFLRVRTGCSGSKLCFLAPRCSAQEVPRRPTSKSCKLAVGGWGLHYC